MQNLSELFAFQPCPSPIPSEYPSWASWKSQEVYLPAEFHLASAFKKALSIGSKALEKCVLLKDGRIDAPLLLLGLMYREASRAMEIEPGAATDIPVCYEFFSTLTRTDHAFYFSFSFMIYMHHPQG